MIRFDDTERAELKAAFECTHNQKIHVVYLRGLGVSRKEVAAMFLLSLPTVTNYCDLYKQKGVAGLLAKNYKGSRCLLSAAQQAELQAYLDNNYVQGNALEAYLWARFQKRYSRSGALRLAHRLGYVSKKQNAFLAKPIRRSKRRS